MLIQSRITCIFSAFSLVFVSITDHTFRSLLRSLENSEESNNSQNEDDARDRTPPQTPESDASDCSMSSTEVKSDNEEATGNDNSVEMDEEEDVKPDLKVLPRLPESPELCHQDLMKKMKNLESDRGANRCVL